MHLLYVLNPHVVWDGYDKTCQDLPRLALHQKDLPTLPYKGNCNTSTRCELSQQVDILTY